MALCAVVLSIATARPGPGQESHEDEWQEARERMVREAVIGAGVRDPRVLRSMRATPRHEFVAPELQPRAYFDMALPIGSSQTISSPFIVAYMTEAIDPQPTDRVLEIGTGSGYQAAILSPLVDEVYTIEIVPELGNHAAATLERLDYENVHVRVGDGFQGWPEAAPFDKIVVTCSPENVPQPLIDQLRDGGRMVIPVGERYQQTLYLYTKVGEELERSALRPTLFVPMEGTAEGQRQVDVDPARPGVVNGDFETPPGESGFVAGWYYQRHAQWMADSDANDENHFLRLQNDVVGRSAHLLQGLAVDGSQVTSVELSARIRARNLREGRTLDESPLVVLSFYNDQREDLGHRWLGPFRGSHNWRTFRETIRVPPNTSECILRVGLFGATGTLDVDDVRLRPR